MSKPTCSIAGCDKPTVGRGWCRKHYGRWHRHGDPLYVTPPTAPTERLCDIEGCGQPHLARGYCSLHWGRWKKHGDPLYEVARLPETCVIEGCGKDRFARDWCSAHYAKWRKYGDPLAQRYGLPPEPCKIDGCDHPGTEGHGWCYLHYRRFWRHGDPMETSRIVGDLEARFWSYVEIDVQEDGCWEWTGATVSGYGVLLVEDRTVFMPRWAYERFVGPIAEGLEPDHLCRVRACVRPDHLEPVTHRVNVLRGVSFAAENARKTHCIRGHEFTPENTYPNGRGRGCLACKKWRDANRPRRKAAA